MAFPKPTTAQVIRYAYLWHKDAVRGLEEGSKDRPCAVVMVVQDDDSSWVVITEANRFYWPGPDLRMVRHGDESSVLYGSQPNTFSSGCALPF